MLKIGANRDLTDSEIRRMRRAWVEDDLPQGVIARIFRVSVERLQTVCSGLARAYAPRAPRASPVLRRA